MKTRRKNALDKWAELIVSGPDDEFDLKKHELSLEHVDMPEIQLMWRDLPKLKRQGWTALIDCRISEDEVWKSVELLSDFYELVQATNVESICKRYAESKC